MDHNTIEKCVAIVVIGIISGLGIVLTKSDALANVGIGAIAGLAGSGLMGGGVAFAGRFLGGNKLKAKDEKDDN